MGEREAATVVVEGDMIEVAMQTEAEEVADMIEEVIALEEGTMNVVAMAEEVAMMSEVEDMVVVVATEMEGTKGTRSIILFDFCNFKIFHTQVAIYCDKVVLPSRSFKFVLRNADCFDHYVVCELIG